MSKRSRRNARTSRAAKIAKQRGKVSRFDYGDPTAAEAAASYGRAWRLGKIKFSDIPKKHQGAVMSGGGRKSGKGFEWDGG